ncbi:hypothetical protein VDGD_20992 [Verticillium dahliae]|nr:hypothetical protein VDGD_20992 [Verticillium dahliae]
MARPTKKQMEEAKKSAVASAPIVAPAPLPIAIPAVQPAPLVAPGLVHQQPRHIDPEGFIRVRDSVSHDYFHFLLPTINHWPHTRWYLSASLSTTTRYAVFCCSA